jgi:hypothetical protein
MAPTTRSSAKHTPRSGRTLEPMPETTQVRSSATHRESTPALATDAASVSSTRRSSSKSSRELLERQAYKRWSDLLRQLRAARARHRVRQERYMAKLAILTMPDEYEEMMSRGFAPALHRTLSFLEDRCSESELEVFALKEQEKIAYDHLRELV